MTVPSDVNKSGPYFGNGVTTAFNYDFKVVDETHLSVVIRDTLSGTQRTLVLNSDYTVTGVGNSGGGQIITTTAPTSNETLTILRNIPFTQDVDLENQGAYYAETVESALDLMVMRDQQLAEELERSIKLPADADPSLLPIMTEGLHRLYQSVDAIDTVAASVADVETVAANIADVNALGPIASDIADVASIKSHVSAVAENLDAVYEVGDIATEIAALGAIPDAIVGVYDIASDVTTVASIKDDVQAVPGLVQDAQDARDDAVDAKNAAQAAAAAAAGSASSASTHASNAANSALASGNAKTAAESARDAAIGAKSDAEAAASMAEDAASDAQGYASDAQGYASAAAGSASTAAGHASNAANAASAAGDAKDDAEDARDAAVLARGVAETARDEAVQAKEDAEAARDQANNIVGNLSGGLAGQFLVKNSNADYDYGWANISGGGDMLTPIYDPNGVAADAFDMDNMVEGASHKILTAAERADIAANTSARHTHSNKAVLDATEQAFTTALKNKLDGIAAGANVTNATTVGSAIHGSSAKATPVDADTVALIDSAASNSLKKLSWANIKSTLKSYFDTLYAAVEHSHSNATTSAAGFMSATDKSKLDGIQEGAQVNAVNSVAGLTGTITDTALFAALGLGNMAYEDSNNYVDKAGDEMQGGLVYRHGDAGTNVWMHSYQFGNKDYASIGVDLYNDGSLDFHTFNADTGEWKALALRIGNDGFVTLNGNPTQAMHAATKGYVDDNFVSFSQEQALSIGQKSQVRVNLGWPRVSIQHIRTGSYNYDRIVISNGGPDILKKMPGVNFNTSNGQFQRQSLREYCRDRGYRVAINCDADNSLGGGLFKQAGLAIFDGVAYQNFDSSDEWTRESIIMQRDGTLKPARYTDGKTAQDYVNEGALWSAGWGPLLVVGGVAQNISWSEVGTVPSARTVLGQRANGDYVILLIEGKSGEYGIAGSALTGLCISEGLVNAMNLDGGGSTQCWWDTAYAHPSSDDQERARGNHLVIDLPGLPTYDTGRIALPTINTSSGGVYVSQVGHLIHVEVSVSGSFATNNYTQIVDGAFPKRFWPAIAGYGRNQIAGQFYRPASIGFGAPIDGNLYVRAVIGDETTINGTLIYRAKWTD